MFLRRTRIIETLKGSDGLKMEAASEAIGGDTKRLNCTLGFLISVFVLR